MNHYKAYCFDLDGTVYHGTEPVPEAVALIEQLQQQGIEPYYITNNSSATPEQVQQKLAGFGIHTKAKYIVTSAIAAAHYCKENFTDAKVQMFGETGLREALLAEGIELVTSNPDIVVMGIDREVTYEKLADLCLNIRAGAKFIATNGDRAMPTERGLLPGTGSFIKLVEYSTGVTPTFMGKPEPFMLSYIQEKSGYSKEDMILIGDNYDTDILAGIRYGIATAHVEGGVTSREEVLLKEDHPTYLLENLASVSIEKAFQG
ncbi:TIGR01457 family HAD-type hydrolase [Sporosarcina pasteurii]|uniref:Uncharacterized hydrolase yutF n=1 Tax=Sporosarcina pasteurii TaxID=1474 RepID=A0A380CAY1_SPOPA|nr:TIGR01457 family HAD-type hydrolase [Sporosarcina pasteurii]MDS9472775.1 TIGR01457 family HAD-type hydrolase [Sporosarcina pasteurii]QBQ04427.1 TIGR01457 family HAD-type hydrolase [Sporosarcina pasteurii]SUJ15152.1 Uncharacterized hydrolase yutF [Sporosarcina pasteurii]